VYCDRSESRAGWDDSLHFDTSTVEARWAAAIPLLAEILSQKYFRKNNFVKNKVSNAHPTILEIQFFDELTKTID
jgi:hypothetical protein